MKRIAFDVECYRDYFLVMFRAIDNKKTHYFEMYPGHDLDRRRLAYVMQNFELVGFNSRNYDVPIITLALAGADNVELKQASDYLILNEQATPWNFEKRYTVHIPQLNHIDLYDVAPGVQVSLKLYGGRMHSPKLQDLPIEPDASISEADRATLREYCINDLDTTIDLHNKLVGQIKLREQMSEQYGQDLRSKSDAQIAEAVIRSEIEKIRGSRLSKPAINTTPFKYRAPEWMKFRTAPLQEIFKDVLDTEFSVDEKGVVKLPATLDGRKVTIGRSEYRMGIGGLHSSENKVSHVVDGTFVLRDYDVTSYYPSIIIGQRLYPLHIGEEFLDVYSEIYHGRVASKANCAKLAAKIAQLEKTSTGDSAELEELRAEYAKEKLSVDSKKLNLNGSYGKFGSPYSVLYSPHLLIQTTITGQLALLMLIEKLESNSIPVVSANTDGIVIKCPVERVQDMEIVTQWWQNLTEFNLEDTEYRALHSRDVNNYVAIKTDGSVKRKGAFAEPGLMKNPTATIVSEAAVAYLTSGADVEAFVRDCDDVTMFLVVRTVSGGGVQDNNYLGKVVRWYYSTQSPGPIVYKKNGNKVASSDGSKALMQLGEFPLDIDYERYVSEVRSTLANLGAC
jgi:DNA polymerase elongation subunit (family B)